MRRFLWIVTASSLILLLAACGSSTSQSSSSSGSGSSGSSGYSSSGTSSTYGHSHRHRRHYSSGSSSSGSGSGYSSSGYSGSRYTGSGSSSSSRRAQPPSKLLGPRSKTSGCQVHGALPDRACTPGAIFASATKDQICVLGYSRRVRFVSSSTKRTAYREYGIMSHSAGQYEVDHLVSLELGGSNSIANLWPEAAQPTPGFHEKDQAENYLHDQVCSGKISLQQAQQQIATNWLTIYHKMGH